MCNKDRAGILLVTLLMVIVIEGLVLPFFARAVSNYNLVRNQIYADKALWAAEAGIAKIKAAFLPPSGVSGQIGDCSYQASRQQIGTTEYYKVISTATCHGVSRTLYAYVKTEPVATTNFQHAIRTTGDLEIKGSVTINGPREEHASLNFADLFGQSKETIKQIADHVYINPDNNPTPVDGITWVEVSTGNELRITTSTWTGSGLLVVSGDTRITGGTFNGIIYVIGRLWMSGNPTINGTILVESRADIDTELRGNVTINYNEEKIRDTLAIIPPADISVVGWRQS